MRSEYVENILIETYTNIFSMENHKELGDFIRIFSIWKNWTELNRGELFDTFCNLTRLK